ncbi:phytanoyl-CoA dioxygenase family protein [Gordonia sp. Z-3]|uniref:Phytanoyl-CoA dioxygenase family protein n=2 Tax=Gordonia TaxID=2053 RepID=A0A9X3D227_9ACTN|nr:MULTISPECIES: phytanoyl-CoA dioxygenase family protein [Gordonia]MAU82691.1 phytanoyl-CoA dioxygenase [Gordonia sp. (in: high G+C Gram-positive bacteria)]MCF3940541.1 phytanoyl-CoA dioxygenase family protein [Gordonia tangerina]MCX2963453.1 phytanoyl-CoA dioxygenase family protein [Gordonia aquimaris]MED5800670.1 phytanoyl-CoA dioxygenase family protein [Gordonia sp. Z-3]
MSSEPGVFGPHELGALVWFYDMHGYATLRGLLTESDVAAVERECTAAQQAVIAGELDIRHGSTVFLDEEAKAQRFANYVEYVSEISPAVRAAVTHPVLADAMARLLGERAWLRAHEQFGVVYQDARPGRESGYTRIGWHSDWQAGPSLDVWPSTAFTIHIDGTSPANGFLRVVPGSHLWATPAPYRNVNGVEVPATARPAGGRTDRPPPFDMPLRFEKVPGEVAVYAERGDILLHDCYLWHSAARATDDDSRRRHVRGGYFGGTKPAAGVEEFIKNAAR